MFNILMQNMYYLYAELREIMQLLNLRTEPNDPLPDLR